ncbi:hypothetical protein Tco_0762710 [Tanacetum coccineum]
MSTLTFPDAHNMVSFLEKPAESDGFYEIIDFLNANQIHYALTVNPTIYTSCIEQFWATTKVKTVNGEYGTDCLPTATIFKELARMGYEKPSQKLTFYKAFFSPQWKFLIHTILQCLSAKSTYWNEFSSTMASAIICLATNQKFNLSKYIFDAMTPITTQLSTSKPQKKQSRRKQKKNTEVPHPSDSTTVVPNEEHVPTHCNDPLLSGEDRIKFTELMNMCTKLSERVLDLEHTKTAQAQEITNLKLKVKKLEKKIGFRTHNFKRLYKFGVTRRVESSDDESLDAQEDASKQRSRIEAIDIDVEVTLVETHRRNDKNDDNLMFVTGVFDGDEIVVETEEPVINAATTTKSIPSAKPKEKDIVQESSENVSTATTMVSTATTTVVATPAITTPPQQRAKGIAFREPVKSSVITRVPSQKSKDKGKAIMIEPEKPLKKKDQIELNEELAREIEAEEQAELERIQKERVAQEEASRAAIYEEWNNEQAMMEANYELVAILQENEREAMSIEEKSRGLVELIRERKKFFAAQRAKAIRNKPPTKTQRRNQMIQYLKNMAGYSQSKLKDKSFDEVQKLFEKHMKWINSFVPMEEDLPSEKVQKEVSSEKKAEGSSRKKSIGRKRSKDKQEQESSKRQRVEDDKEEEELKKCFELAKEEEIPINAIPLAIKVPVVGFQIHTRGKPGYYEIFRADGSSKLYHMFSQLLSEFDREDLKVKYEDLYKDTSKIFGHVYDQFLKKVASPPIVSTSNVVNPTIEKNNDGNISKSSSMAKSMGNSSKKGNITTSNSYSALENDEEEDKEHVENVYDESANLFPNSKPGESSTFTVAAG